MDTEFDAFAEFVNERLTDEFHGETKLTKGPLLDTGGSTVRSIPEFSWDRQGKAFQLILVGDRHRVLINCIESDGVRHPKDSGSYGLTPNAARAVADLAVRYFRNELELDGSEVPHAERDVQ